MARICGPTAVVSMADGGAQAASGGHELRSWRVPALLVGAAVACIAALALAKLPASPSTPPLASRYSLQNLPTRLPVSLAVAATGPTGKTSTAPHIMVIVEENRNRSEVIGNAGMPYLNSLATRYENTTNWDGVGHPSLPNYLALISGSTQGVTSDESEPFPGVATLGSQLTAAGIPWTAYMEDMPEAAYTGVQAGLYVKKHNPFAFFPGTNGPNVVPGSQYATDLAAGTLPAFVWYSPNRVNDGHELSNTAVDANLKSLLTPLLQSQWYSQGGTVIVTYDEDEGEHKVPTVVIHGTGTSSTDTASGNHCGTLAAIEHTYGLSLLGCASGATPLELPATGSTEAGGLGVGINGIASRGAVQAKPVQVRTRVSLHVSTTTPAVGARVKFSGSVTPAHDGQMVLIQRRSRTGRFVTVATTELLHTTTGGSIYRKTLRIKASGTYRVIKSHDAHNAIGVSALRRITVH